MESRIGEKLVELINPIINVSYMVAQVDKFPYCAYEINNESPLRTKHGIYGSQADVSIYVVAKKESQAAQYRNRIVKALPRERYWDFKLDGISAETDGEHWAYKIDYTITRIFEND